MSDEQPPTPKPPGRGPGPGAEVCPTPEELAAYLAGGLGAADRARIEDHISRCDDCHFVLRETAILESELKPAAEPIRQRARPRLATYLMPLAATLVVGVGSAVLWRQAHPADSYAETIRPLVDAVGPRRFVEARLTGGFRYGPLVGRKRAAGSADPEQWPLFAAAEAIRKVNAEHPTPEGQKALAAAHLILGETDQAVTLFERLARESPRDAALLSDLAAAYLTRAAEGRDEDYPRAFEYASRSVEVDPKRSEAWFNRALAADALALATEAEESRRHVRELEGESEWSRSVGDRKGSSIEPRTPTRKDILRAPPGDVASLVARGPAEARDAIQLDLLPTGEPADLERAVTLATAYRDTTGDVSLLAEVQRLSQAPTPVRTTLVEAHRAFADGREALDRGDTLRATVLLQKAVALRAKQNAPRDDGSLFYLGVIAYREGRKADALTEFARIGATTESAYMKARCHWMEALVCTGRGDLPGAVRGYRSAQELFLGLNDRANVANVESLLADVHLIVGGYEQAWRHQRAALSSLGILSDPVRRHMVFMTAATASMETGLPRTAMAFTRRALQEDASADNSLLLAESHMFEAWVATVVEPAAVRRSFEDAERILNAIPAGSLRERFEAELAWTRGQLVDPFHPSVAIDELGRSIRFFATRGFDARLPFLYGVRGRAFQSAGRLTEAKADLHSGLEALAAVRDRGEAWPRLTMSERSWRVVDDLVALEIEVEKDPENALALIETERAATQGDAAPFTVESLRKRVSALPHDTAILAYYCAGARVHAWALRHDGVHIAALPITTSELEALVADFSPLVVEGRIDSFDALSERLYLSLIAPVEPWLEGVKDVAVVPDGPVSRLAIGALHRPGAPFLAERWAIRIAPHVSLGRPPKGSSGSSRRTLLVLRGTGGPALAGTQRENDTIAALYDDVLRVAGSDGRDVVLQALASSDVFHFGGHATLNPLRPDLSGLLLGRTPAARSEILGVGDISRQDLRRLRLVTLAGCDAAGGVSLRSVGPVTVAGAFLRAGAAAVVAPVGPIDDRFATRIFTELHRRYRVSGDVQSDLQAIQRDLLANGDRSEAVRSLNLVVMLAV